MSNFCSIREESRIIYPGDRGKRLAKRARIGIGLAGLYALGDPLERDEKAGGTSQPRRHVPVQHVFQPLTPVQPSIRWDRQLGYINTV